MADRRALSRRTAAEQARMKEELANSRKLVIVTDLGDAMHKRLLGIKSTDEAQ